MVSLFHFKQKLLNQEGENLRLQEGRELDHRGIEKEMRDAES